MSDVRKFWFKTLVSLRSSCVRCAPGCQRVRHVSRKLEWEIQVTDTRQAKQPVVHLNFVQIATSIFDYKRIGFAPQLIDLELCMFDKAEVYAFASFFINPRGHRDLISRNDFAILIDPACIRDVS